MSYEDMPCGMGCNCDTCDPQSPEPVNWKAEAMAAMNTINMQRLNYADLQAELEKFKQDYGTLVDALAHILNLVPIPTDYPEGCPVEYEPVFAVEQRLEQYEETIKELCDREDELRTMVIDTELKGAALAEEGLKETKQKLTDLEDEHRKLKRSLGVLYEDVSQYTANPCTSPEGVADFIYLQFGEIGQRDEALEGISHLVPSLESCRPGCTEQCMEDHEPCYGGYPADTLQCQKPIYDVAHHVIELRDESKSLQKKLAAIHVAHQGPVPGCLECENQS